MRLKNVFSLTILGLMVWLIAPGSIAMADKEEGLRHENPDSTETYYDSVAILNYYTLILDHVLERVTSEVMALRSKKPFANIPHGLNNSLEDFTDASVNISESIVQIESGLEDWNQLANQYQLAEIAILKEELEETLNLAYSELWQIENCVEVAEGELGVPPPGNQEPLRRSYDDTTDRIEQLNNLIGFLQGMVGAMSVTQLQAKLQVTTISLIVEPQAQFVGENITVKGRLTSEGTSLSNRPIVILFEGVPFAEIQTDNDGNYEDFLQIPYRYISTVTLQAIYYPREGDTGKYQGSKSDPVEIDLLFSACDLNLKMYDRAYPGLEIVLEGRFECADDSPLINRTVELYLDGNLLQQTQAGVSFVEKISLDSEIALGTHCIMVIVPSNKRYAPVSAQLVFQVEKAVPIIDVRPPSLAVMPFGLKLNGKVYTEFGPLGNTPIEASFRGHKTQAITTDDGSFSLKLDTGLNFSIIGSEKLEITVASQESWASPISSSWNLIAINSVSVGTLGLAFIAALIVLIKRLVVWFRQREKKPVTDLSPFASIQPAWSALRKQRKMRGKFPKKGLGDLVLETYAALVKRLQNLTGVILSPGMTFREFSDSCPKLLGSGQFHLDKLTRIVERILYSKHSTSFTDWDESQELNQMVEKSISYEGA